MTVNISRAKCEGKKKKLIDKHIRILKFGRIHEQEIDRKPMPDDRGFSYIKRFIITCGQLDLFGKTRLDINFKTQSNYHSLKNK